MSRLKINRIFFSLLMLAMSIFSANSAIAQGSITGLVSNSNASTPANGELSLYGYLENRDEEIRIEGCVGTGYDNGNWYDHLPNYLTETPGDPISYHFFNIANNESFLLSGVIEPGSYQQANIILLSFSLPPKPTGLTAYSISGPAIELNWTAELNITYHIYRRDASSNGSFFRIDDPSGQLSNAGVVSSPYIDNSVDGGISYDYIIIAENSSGDLGPHSEIITASSVAFICGDVDNNGIINILDIVYFINFKYKGGASPDILASADVNNDAIFNILDLVALINFKYKGGADLNCPAVYVYP